MTATIYVHDKDGNPAATRLERIEAQLRNSQLLTQYFPVLVGQNRSSGCIGVRTEGGVASFALFGTESLTAFSALPHQAVP